MRLNQAWNVDDFRRKAKRRLPKIAFDFLDSGVLDKNATNNNYEAYRQYDLRPEALFPSASVNTGTKILGVDVDFPLMVSPMGSATLFDNSSDIGLARGAAGARSIFMHSVVASVSIEETVENIEPERCWVQVLIRDKEEKTAQYLERIKHLGIKTIVINTETRFADAREIDYRNGLQRKGWPPNPPLSGIINIAMRPGFIFRILFGRKLTRGDYDIDGRPVKMSEIYSFLEEFQENTWDEVKRIRELWDGNLVLKGIMNTEDALKAVEIGADAVFVSNLGGRQFDQAPSTLTVLPEIASVVKEKNSKVEVYVDGGVSRGSDVLKAIALGADAVSAGRSFSYALGGFGAKGVHRLYGLLKKEFFNVMTNVGAATVGDISPKHLRPKK